MNNLNEIAKVLDNGWKIALFRNMLDSYTAVAINLEETIEHAMENYTQITDDFSPTKVLYRLSEKISGCGEYS